MENENNLPLEQNIDLKPEKKPFNFFKIFSLVFLFLILFLISFFINLNKAPKDFVLNQIFIIKQGDSLRTISKNLREQNYIKSRVLFESFVILFGGEKSLNTGDYSFKQKYSTLELADRISKGQKDLNPIKITIPEGFTKEEIIELLDKKLHNFDADKFNKETKEGYLFPDTYFFLSSDDENTVIKTIEENFIKKTNKIFENLSLEKQKEILIMASILEGEAKGDSDRNIISGILWKRLSINMPLQVDIAPITYKERGLPDNPISNPGTATILAALNPISSPYLYYIHDKEGNTYFAKTFKEHRVNIEKYLK